MVFTNYGTQALAWQLGSNLTNNYISYFAIGSGSGTALVTNVTLANETGTRVAITGSPDFTAARIVTFVGDYAANQISGLQLTEFGLFHSGAVLEGSTWLRESFTAVSFDGSVELSLSAAIQLLPG